jgi:tRNA-splicing ligase RtcB
MAAPLPHGIISPGSVGYDINCGVRLLASRIDFEAVEPFLPELAGALYHHCPSGVGQQGSVPLPVPELERVCREGARWALKAGYGRDQDLDRTEEFGCLDGADPNEVSGRAKERGRSQLGSLGAGNHFIEVDVVDQVFEANAANTLGLVRAN